VTPLGFLWRDMGQMRPGSGFLKSLHRAEIPEGVTIYCLHSERDRVATGPAGVFRPKGGGIERVKPVAMNHISHFEFLYRRDVGDTISMLLREGEEPRAGLAPPVAEAAGE
jgi:hypothetical protein